MKETDILEKYIGKMKKPSDFFNHPICRNSLCGGLEFFVILYDKFPERFLYGVYKEALMKDSRHKFKKQLFTEKLESKIRKLGKKEILANTHLLNLADEGGFITVYRGHTEDIEHTSASWTASLKCAHHFGKRHASFDKLPYYCITKGRADINDILAYITEKNEDEIVILPKYVKEKTREIFEF